MSKKTIWPEWIDDRIPTREDADFDNEVLFYNSKNDVFQYCHWKHIEFGDNWQRITGIHNGDYIFKYLATPEECEARKKEQAWKPESVSFHKGENGIAFSVQGSYEAEKNEDANPWIPGNEPDRSDFYELTISGKKETIFGRWYSGTRNWSLVFMGDIELTEIIAYRKPKHSKPYVPPEPERELLCPFCHSNECRIDKYEDFECESCGVHIPTRNEYDIFELYDKLNP